jgi:hypothetical protein
MASRGKELGAQGLGQYLKDGKNILFHVAIGSAAALLSLLVGFGPVGIGVVVTAAELLMIGKASEMGFMD